MFCDSLIEEASLARFVGAYQEQAVLTLGDAVARLHQHGNDERRPAGPHDAAVVQPRNRALRARRAPASNAGFTSLELVITRMKVDPEKQGQITEAIEQAFELPGPSAVGPLG